MRVQTTGFRELDRALGELPKAAARNTLKRALKKVAQPVADAAQERAPRRDGDLQISVTVSFQLTARQRSEAKREGKSFAEVHIGPKSGKGVLNYATKIEFDHQAFMRPAWDAHQKSVLDALGQELWAEIDKTRARLARKAARGG